MSRYVKSFRVCPAFKICLKCLPSVPAQAPTEKMGRSAKSLSSRRRGAAFRAARHARPKAPEPSVSLTKIMRSLRWAWGSR